jgi:hypothetical protein
MITPYTLRPVLLSVLACATAAGSLAQTDKLKVKVRMSADERAADKREVRNLFAVNERNILVVSGNHEGSSVQNFSKAKPRLDLLDRSKMNVARSIEPDVTVSGYDMFLEDVVLFGGQPVILATRRDTIQGFVQLNWQHYDENLARRPAPYLELCRFDAMVQGNNAGWSEGTAHRDPFRASLAPDGSFLLALSPEVIGTDGKRRMLMGVADPKMKLMWHRTMDLAHGERFASAQLDTAGNVHLLVARPSVKKTTPGDTLWTHHLLLVNGMEVTERELPLADGRHISNALFVTVPDGRVALAGVHAGMDDKGKNRLANFLAFLHADEAPVEFSIERKFAYDPELGFMAHGVRLLNALPKSNGGFFLVNEYFVETEKPITKLAISGRRWVHGPIAAVSMDPDGEEEWESIFVRLHLAYDPAHGEVFSMLHNDELVLFLLDSDELVQRRKKNEKPEHTDMRKHYSAYVHFTPDGSFKAKGVLRTGGSDDIIQGRELYHAGPGEYYVLAGPKLGAAKLLPVKIEFTE